MLGSKRTKKRGRKHHNKVWAAYGWQHPESRMRRSIMKRMTDIPDGSHYKKIGSWFEWC